MQDNNISNVFRALGASVTMVGEGMNTEAARPMAKHASVISDPKEPGYEHLHRLLCKVAADAFAHVGETGSYQHCLYTKLASAEKWYPQFGKYSDRVLTSLGYVKRAMEKEYREDAGDLLVKQANPLALPIAVGRGGLTMAPGVVKGLAALGLLGGAGVGALTWQAGREVSEDNDEIETLKAKRDMYTRLAEEIALRSQDEELTRDEIKSSVGSLY